MSCVVKNTPLRPALKVLKLGQPRDEANASVSYISGTGTLQFYRVSVHSRRCEDLLQQISAIQLGDADLKRPFKEAVRTPLTRRIIEFAGPEFKMPANIKFVGIKRLHGVTTAQIVKQEVKETVCSNSSSKNIAFVSYPSPSSTNEVPTAYGVSTASTQSSIASTQVSTANLSDATIYAFLSNQSNGSQPVHEDLEQIHKDDLEEIDLKTVNVEETPPKAMVAIDGVGFDWSYMAEDEVPTNIALMAFSDSEPEFESYRPKSCKIESKNASKNIPNELKESTKVKESSDVQLVKKLVSDDKLEKKTVVPTVTKIEFLKAKQQENQLGNQLIHYARPMSRFSKSTQSTVKRPFQQRTSLINKSFRPRLVNTTRPRPVNTVRPRPVNTVRPRLVNTARPNPVVINAVRVNQVNAVKASACWVWRPTKPNGASITLKRHNYIDVRGRSKKVMAWVPKGN
nr:hypothetical protein [Tanacetum cinerariifolium]